MSSPTLSLSAVDEYAESFIAPRVSMISGVAQVDVHGAQKYAVRVRLDPQALATRSIGIDEVEDAVQRQNVNMPTGTLHGARRVLTLKASGQLLNAEAYRPLIVAYRNGSPVLLQDLGKVIDSVENDKVASWYNDARMIFLAVQRQPGTNTIEVVDSIKALLPQLRALLPASVSLDVTYDRSVSIRESVGDVKITLFVSLCLVVLVIFLFLRNLSATVIPSLALPMSIVGTFTVMYLMDFTIDNLSLMALTLSVGFVVDDAIVMLENIVRHMEAGEDVFEAARNGSREIGFTIVSMTLSLAAVFIPVLFMGGILGRLFHEFAVVISVAILISGFVALSLTPMLGSLILKPERESKSAFHRIAEGAFQAVHNVYAWSLRGVLRYRFLALAVAAGTLMATIYLFGLVPKGFISSQDIGILSGSTEAPQDISFNGMAQVQKQAADILLANPNIEAIARLSARAGGRQETTPAALTSG